MKQTRLRFQWSHQALWHRTAIRVFNAIMQWLPFSIKYGVGMKMRTHSVPYSLIRDCRVVVQVGAPRDTLQSGRSRAMYFALFSDPKNRVIIVEPDPESAKLIGNMLKRQGIANVSVCAVGAWSEKKNLQLCVNNAHPASNFIEGLVNYDDNRLREYHTINIPVNTVDNILTENGIEQVDLVSITTNGAEREILQGMRKTLEAGVKYIALNWADDYYVQLMEKMGYTLMALDDRGYTFRKNHQ